VTLAVVAVAPAVGRRMLMFLGMVCVLWPFIGCGKQPLRVFVQVRKPPTIRAPKGVSISGLPTGLTRWGCTG